MRRWPDTLPTPSSPGFGLSPVDPAIRSDMGVGAARVRRVTITAATGTGVANPLMRISLLNDAQVASYLGGGVVGMNACEKGVRHVTGYELHLRADAAGNALGAAGSAGWAFVPIAVGGVSGSLKAALRGRSRPWPEQG